MSLEARLREWVGAIEHSDPSKVRDAAVGLCRAVGEGGGSVNAQASQALMGAIQKRPQAFRQPEVLPLLMRYLRGGAEGRAGGSAGGGGVQLQRLASNALARSFRDSPEWPVEFIQAFMDDALGARTWVEDAECKLFVDNLRTAWDRKKVNTVLTEAAVPASPSRAPMELSSSSSNLETPVNPGAGAGQVVPRTLSLAVSNMDSDSDSGEEEVLEVGLVAGGGSVVSPPAAAPRAGGAVAAADSDSDSGDEEVLEVAVVGVQSPPFQSAAPVETPLPAVWPRYQQSQEAVRQVISQSMESRLHGQSTGPMGQVIATLTDLTASPFCRRLAMDYLERWLSTPAQSQKAKTLLAAVIREVDPACPDDAGVIEALLNLKLPVQQDKLFTESIAALVQKQPQVLHKVLRFFLTEGVSSSSSGTSSYKALARILAHALQSQQQQQQEGRRPLRTQWLSRASVGRELAAMLKEFILQGKGAQAKEACLATVKTLTLEQCDLLRLVGELLHFPTDLFKPRPPDGPPAPVCAPRDYVQTLVHITMELCKFRGAIVGEVTKTINDAYKKEQKNRTMTEGEAERQRFMGLWRCRLALVKDAAEIHALVARFVAQVADHIPVALREPEPEAGQEADAASLTSGGAIKKRLKRGERALALFRSTVFVAEPDHILLQIFHPDRLPPTDKAQQPQQRSGDQIIATYFGVKGATIRAMLQLSTCPPVRALPADSLLTQVEALVYKAAEFQFRRESDKFGSAVTLGSPAESGGGPSSCVELSFPDHTVIQDIFAIARFNPPANLEPELQLVVKLPLADASLFWRAALLLLVVSGSNPSSVGRWLWHHCPTLRCLMQMVVCSQYQFPPPGAATILPEQAWYEGGASGGGASSAGAAGGGNFSAGDKQMLLADAELADEEAQAMAILKGDEGGAGGGGGASLKKKKRKRLRMLEEEAMGNRTRSRTKAAEAKAEGQKEGGVPRLIMLDLGMVPRKPPPDVLQQLQTLDRKFGIGARFRRSTEPDFVAAAIAGDDSTRVSRVMIESSIGWLAPAVAAEPDVTMKRLPLGCICYMLMMAYMSDSTTTDSGSSSSSQAKGQPGKPLARTAPQLVLDAEAAAAEAEGGEAEGVKAAHAALVRLRAPLRSAVSAALTDESKEDKAGMALGLFLSEVGHPSSKRRSAARKALESIMGLASEAEEAAAAAMDVVDEDEEDDSGGIKTRKPFKASELSGIIRSKRFLSQAAKEHCSWVFRLDRLPSLRQSKRPVLDALSQALQVEASHYVISYYLLALYSLCHSTAPLPSKAAVIEQFDASKAGAARGGLSSPSFFSWLLCTALAGRRLVMQATAERFPLLQSLIMDEVYATIQEAATKPPASKDKARLWLGDRQVRILLPDYSQDEPVLLPYALLQACVAVLSVFSDPQPPPTLAAVLKTLFPPTAADASTDTSRRAIGAAGATLAQELEEPALSAEDWIHLAKCPCPAVSEGTSRCMPALLLCRLLLCSGLSDHCFRAALERIDGLGRSDSTGEAYRDLLSPASTASWGMARALGTRKALTRKLFRRVTAYLRLQGAGAAGGLSGSSRFLEWLNREVASAEMETQKDQRADRSTAAGMLAITALPPAVQQDESAARPAVQAPAATSVTQVEAAAMLVRLTGQVVQPKPPAALLPSPRPALLSGSQPPLDSQADLAQQWSSVEGAEAAVRQVVERLQVATSSPGGGTVQLLQRCMSDVRQLLHVALRSLPTRKARRGLKRPRASSAADSAAPAGDDDAMVVDEEKTRRPPTPADVAMEVLAVLHPQLVLHAPYSPAPPAVLQAGYLACDLCCAFWSHASLSARCHEVLWALLFAPPPSSPASPAASPRPLLRPALLSRTLRSLSADQLAGLAHGLLQHCSSTPEGALDLQSSLAVMVTYLRHPRAAPLVFEIGCSPFTTSLFAKLLTPKPSVAGGSQGQAPSTLSLRTPSHLNPAEISALLTIVLAALGPQPVPLPPRTRDFVSSSLIIQLIQRNPVLCCPVAQCLLTTIRTTATLAAVPSSSSDAMDVDDDSRPPPSSSSFAETLLLRLYLAFPSEVAPILKTSRLDAKTIIGILCRGQQGAGFKLRLGDNYFERRLPDDIAQLSRLGSDTRQDSESTASLTETAKRHPFLLLRHLPSLIRLLEWDASCTTAREDASFAPFYLRKRAAPPPDSVLTASVPGGRGGHHVRFTYWGRVFNLTLWQHLLALVCEMPPKVLMAYTDATASGWPVILDFVLVYVRLLAAWKPDESPPMLADRVSVLLNVLRKERQDVVDSFSKKRIPGAKATPADVLARHCRKPQQGEAVS